jgi:acetylornithine deacetylase/succinyl-diaminopimelate desuccinylase-like protein
VDAPVTDLKVLATYVDKIWEDSVVDALSSYVAIPCLSPDYDPEWATRGEIARAAQLLSNWVKSREIPGCRVKIAQRDGLTPVVIADVPATPGAETSLVTLLYGHFDKQPPLDNWREGLDPFVAVREGDRLYGRGAGDDGYALFSAISALEALTMAGAPHGRCVVLIEGSEESGSPHLAPYLEQVETLIGAPGPGLVVCLDSGCASYDRLWVTVSLRGMIEIVLRVAVLTEAVHSGTAGGTVPSSFRILRQLLSRIEDEATGEILVPECGAPVPEAYRVAVEAVAAELGDNGLNEFPTVASLALSGSNPAEQLLKRTWMPSLAVTGIDGAPPVKDAGNVIRPSTAAKLSMRLSPSADAGAAAKAVERILSADPPQGAEVKVEVVSAAPGLYTPSQAEWLSGALNEASQSLFGARTAAIGEGGSIPFLAQIAARFPRAQFLITGVLGPESNAHGVNEMLHLPTARRLTAAVAYLLASTP